MAAAYKTAATASTSRDGVAQADGRGDAVQGLDALAGAQHADGAEAEKAAPQALVDIHRLDFVHVHLDGVTANEALLVDHAVIGDGELDDRAFEPGEQEGKHEIG